MKMSHDVNMNMLNSCDHDGYEPTASNSPLHIKAAASIVREQKPSADNQKCSTNITSVNVDNRTSLLGKEAGTATVAGPALSPAAGTVTRTFITTTVPAYDHEGVIFHHGHGQVQKSSVSASGQVAVQALTVPATSLHTVAPQSQQSVEAQPTMQPLAQAGGGTVQQVQVQAQMVHGNDDRVLDTMVEKGGLHSIAFYPQHTIVENSVLGLGGSNAVNDVNLQQPGQHKQQQQELEHPQPILMSNPSHAPAPPAASNRGINIKEEQWTQMLNRLIAFKAQHNHTTVPKRYPDDPKLGTWVETQRAQFKKMWNACATNHGLSEDILASTPNPTIYVTPNTRLTAGRLERLQAVGFSWSVRKNRAGGNSAKRKLGAGGQGGQSGNGNSESDRDLKRNRRNDAQWNEMYQRLVQYRNIHGDCLVSKGNAIDSKLACWVETQRHLYSKYYSQGEAQLGVDSKPGVQSQMMHENSNSNSAAANQVSNVQNASLGHVRTFEQQQPTVPLTCHTTQAVVAAIQDACAAAATGTTKGTATKASKESMEVVQGGDDFVFGQSTTLQTSGTKTDALNGNLDAGIVAEQNLGQKRNVRLTKERKEKLDDIGFVWSLRLKKNEEHWEEMFAALIDFKSRHGNCLVPSRFSGNTKLSKWVETVRAEYTKLKCVESLGSYKKVPSTKLTAARIKRLEDVGFEWRVKGKSKRPDVATRTSEGASLTESPSVYTTYGGKKNNDRQWDTMFAYLVEFKETFGHTKVPKRYKENKQLGTWVDTQRVQYKKLQQRIAKGERGAESTRLTNDRIQRLVNIGFVWSIRDDWQKHYNELVEYKATHGHCNVPARYTQNNKLGIWVTSQRQQYKHYNRVKAGTIEKRAIPLTEERIGLLEDIGFIWSIRSNENVAENWQQRFEELCIFKSQHGHCNVPSRYLANRALAAWCVSQRANYKEYMKTKDEGKDMTHLNATAVRIQQLEQVGFEWSIRTPETVWKKRLDELREFKLTFGADCPVPSDYRDNQRLGLFAKTQRAQRLLFNEGKPSTLDFKKISELDSLGFCWNVTESTEENLVDHQVIFQGGIQQTMEETDEIVLRQPQEQLLIESQAIGHHESCSSLVLGPARQMQGPYGNQQRQGEVEHEHENEMVHINPEDVQDTALSHEPNEVDYDRTMSLIAIPNVEEHFPAIQQVTTSHAATASAPPVMHQNAINPSSLHEDEDSGKPKLYYV